VIFDPVETMSVDERAALQNRRLRLLVDRLLAAGGQQAVNLREAGVERGDSLSLEDLSRLPTVGKPDLWQAYPLGMLAVPLEVHLE
jgi:phenylacetate-CoA ligase